MIRFIFAVAALLVLVKTATADRPRAAEILPEKTVLYVQFDNIPELVEKFNSTGFGQMMQDERIAPLVESVYEQASTAYSQIEEQVGASLDEIWSLPSGEVCFALVAPRRADPAGVLMIDIAGDNETLDRLLEKGIDLAEREGAQVNSEEDGELAFQVIDSDGDFDVVYIRYEDTLLISTDIDVAKDIMARWQGQITDPKDRSLAQNRKFVTIMNRCSPDKEVKAEFSLFIDPIEMARAFTRGSVGGRAALGFLPVVGLDGLLGIGASAIYGQEGYESILHGHVLLSNPRNGIFKMLAMKPGELTPETWVPNNVPSYMTTHWDFNTIYNEIEDIFNTFNAETTWEEEVVQEISNEVGIDLKQELVENLEGRITYFTWMEQPPRFNSQCNVMGIQLNDPSAFQDMINKLIAKAEEEDDAENLRMEEYRGVEYYQIFDEDSYERFKTRREEREQTVEIRFPRPTFVILGDHFVISDGGEFIESAIDTYKGDGTPLADDELFQRVASETRNLVGTSVPGMTMYSRPDLQFKNLFELLQSGQATDVLDRFAEDNELAAGVRDALEDNPLPDFEEIAHYFPPGGGFATNDDTGWHFMFFQIKPDTEK